MSSRFLISHSTPRKGAALIVTLLMIVLVTVMVVAFMSRAKIDSESTHSFSLQPRATDLADSAREEIIAALLLEMREGSSPQTIPMKPSVPNNLLPSSNIEVGAAAQNLLKISKSGKPFFSSQKNWSFGGSGADILTAADVVTSSADSSTSGRRIDGQRWVLPRLVPEATFTPALTPDWIYTTRGGSHPTAFSPSLVSSQSGENLDYVIGRFAYACYDLSGLLDVNVAGYPSEFESAAWRAPWKGNLLYASLVTDNTNPFPIPGFVQTDENNRSKNLFTVRYFDNQELLGTDQRPATGVAAEAGFNDYFGRYVRDFGNLLSGPLDSRFLNRSDILFSRFQNDLKQMYTNWEPFSYLTHFSRGVNAPSHQFDDADSTAINAGLDPDLTDSNYLVSDKFFRRDGSVANVGDPLILRFPFYWTRALPYLATKETSGTGWGTFDRSGIFAEGRAPARKAYFGLKPYQFAAGDDTPTGTGANREDRILQEWNLGNYALEYEDAEGGRSIKTLAEVADLNREPNFFEMLQAALLQRGLAPSASNAAILDTIQDVYEDRHTFQIAANMFDADDDDSNPTVLVYRDAGGRPRWVAGVEDLPFIQLFTQTHIYDTAAQATALGSTAPQGQFRTYMQFQLWNPHAEPAPGSLNPRPAREMRIQATDGAAATRLRIKKPDPDPSFFPVQLSAPRDFYNEKPSITFPLNVAGAPFSPDPKLLRQNVITATSNGTDRYGSAGVGFNIGRVALTTDEITNTTLRGDIEITYGANEDPPAGPPFEEGPEFVLLTKLGANRWIPYQKLRLMGSRPATSLDGIRDDLGSFTPYESGRLLRLESNAVRAESSKTDQNATDLREGNTFRTWFGGSDPRTTRFGFTAGNNGYNISLGPVDRVPTAADSFIKSGPHGGQINAQVKQPHLPGNTHLFPLAVAASNGDPVPGKIAYGNRDKARGAAGIEYRPADNAHRDNPPIADPFNMVRRPFVLNRGSGSIGGLGGVFRDVPWTSLDFNTGLDPLDSDSIESTDAAILDYFTMVGAPLRAGMVNLNSATKPVLSAILLRTVGDTAKVPLQLKTNSFPSGSLLTTAEVQEAVNEIVDYLGPRDNPKRVISNPADLTAMTETVAQEAGWPALKRHREAIVRAFSDVTNSRTWNIMIDLIAQSGQLKPNAQDLGDFNIQAEQRIWVYVAIDRITGQIVDIQTEQPLE